MNKRLLFIFGLIVLAAVSRMIPHPYNFAPLGAMSLFGAAYFTNKRIAFILPLVAFFISDLLVNNILYADYYTSFVFISPGFIWTYGAMLLIVLAGIFLLKKINLKRIIGGSLTTSVIFFVVSNFGVWLTSPLYPLSLEGFIACYAMAIPFFHMTVLGDLFYCGVLFGVFEFAKSRIPVLQKA